MDEIKAVGPDPAILEILLLIVQTNQEIVRSLSRPFFVAELSKPEMKIENQRH